MTLRRRYKYVTLAGYDNVPSRVEMSLVSWDEKRYRYCTLRSTFTRLDQLALRDFTLLFT